MEHVTTSGKPAAHVPEPHGKPIHPAAHPDEPHRAAAPAAGPKVPETFAAKVADISTRLDVAVSAMDRDAVDACIEDAEALSPATPEDHLEHLALLRRLAHFGPMVPA